MKIAKTPKNPKTKFTGERNRRHTNGETFHVHGLEELKK
jgi:hypothetical protein